MDDIARRSVYESVLRLIEPEMSKVMRQWSDMGKILTPGEDLEMKNECGRIALLAGRATTMVTEAIEESTARIELSDACDKASEFGFVLVHEDDLDDDDDDDKEEIDE